MSDKEPGTICYEAHGNLYLNITNRCTARCTFCIREQADGVCGYDLWLLREPTIKEIKDVLSTYDLSRYREVVFTGFGEPTTRLDVVLEITRWLKGRGKRVRLDTNGHTQLMYPDRDVVTELKQAGLDAVSVSLNAESEETYNKICRPKLENAYQAMLDLTRSAVNADIETRMSVVRLSGVDINQCETIAHDMGVDLHIR
ncbi:MAG: TatD family nuclease-associated radical SAM protein [Methanosarcinaceae archaeon]|nr:TatD family nuclease-associated radical SAM protein [Methanosarcinaceae archaeon]